MVAVKTVEEFAKQNEKQLRKMFSSKTGIYDKNIIDDIIQEFYIKLIQTKALETFDKDQAYDEKGFSNYMFTLLCWLMPKNGEKNFRHSYEVLSSVSINKDSANKKEVDIWDIVSGFGGGSYYHETRLPDELLKKQLKDERSKEVDLKKIKKFGKKTTIGCHKDITCYKIDPMFRTSFLDRNEEEEFYHDFERFKDFVRKTETPKWADKMIRFMDYKVTGCRSVDIATILNVTSTMIKYIKTRARDKYRVWKGKDAVR